MVGDNVGGAVSGSRVHFQIWKVWLCKKMKNGNKIGKKSEKKREWLVMMLGG